MTFDEWADQRGYRPGSQERMYAFQGWSACAVRLASRWDEGYTNGRVVGVQAARIELAERNMAAADRALNDLELRFKKEVT